MKISEHQLIMLIDTLKDSLRIADGGEVFTYSTDARTDLINEIINQQDNTPKEIGS